jgi:hypothetical protein
MSQLRSGCCPGCGKEMEPQITRNTQRDADEAEVSRPSNRIVWLCGALAWICVFRVICGSIFLLAATQLAVAVVWLN